MDKIQYIIIYILLVVSIWTSDRFKTVLTHPQILHSFAPWRVGEEQNVNYLAGQRQSVAWCEKIDIRTSK